MKLIDLIRNLRRSRDNSETISLEGEKSRIADQLIGKVESAVMTRLNLQPDDVNSAIILATAKVIIIPQVDVRSEDEIREITKMNDDVGWRRKIIEGAVNQIIEDLKKK